MEGLARARSSKAHELLAHAVGPMIAIVAGKVLGHLVLVPGHRPVEACKATAGSGPRSKGPSRSPAAPNHLWPDWVGPVRRVRETGFVAPAQSRTVAWREIDGIELLAEVFPPERPDQARGLLLWFHGGGLILGGRMDVPDELVDLAGRQGFPLVSAEYRLAPQAGIEDIASDAYAALRWAQTEGSRLLGCDGGQTVVAGLSAGGYLALLVGLADPRPKAVISYYGYGTLDSPWYSEPSAPHFAGLDLVTEQGAREAVGHTIVTDGRVRPDAWKFYIYCRQTGQWPTLAAGVPARQQRQVLRNFSPTYHVTKAYPPTMLLHGTSDGDVPYRESAAMAAILALHDVEHELITLEGLDHGLDPGQDPRHQRAVQTANLQAAAFITRHITAAPRGQARD